MSTGTTGKKPELERLQSWMQAVLTHPRGVDEGSQMHEACRHLDVEGVESVVEPSSTLSSAERLAIYSRGYRARLLECFRAEFPCLLHACGDDLFRHFVEDYLEHYPPHSYTLNLLAEDFPHYLAETRPNAGAAAEERESWPDFLIDLATLERSFNEVFDGPGLESEPLPDSEKVRRMTLRQLEGARFEGAPCLRLLSLSYPVHEYFTAVRRGESPALPVADSTYLALTRKNYTVRLHSLARGELELLRTLARGLTVAEACAEVTRKPGEAGPISVLEARASLETWTEQLFFTSPPSSATTSTTARRRRSSPIS